jgi:hypothetical protein
VPYHHIAHSFPSRCGLGSRQSAQASKSGERYKGSLWVYRAAYAGKVTGRRCRVWGTRGYVGWCWCRGSCGAVPRRAIHLDGRRWELVVDRYGTTCRETVILALRCTTMRAVPSSPRDEREAFAITTHVAPHRHPSQLLTFDRQSREH